MVRKFFLKGPWDLRRYLRVMEEYNFLGVENLSLGGSLGTGKVEYWAVKITGRDGKVQFRHQCRQALGMLALRALSCTEITEEQFQALTSNSFSTFSCNRYTISDVGDIVECLGRHSGLEYYEGQLTGEEMFKALTPPAGLCVREISHSLLACESWVACASDKAFQVALLEQKKY